MKLASYNDGSRDGQLVVVSRDLASAHYATGIATRLQQVLDDWNFLSPQLEALSQNLNHGKARHAFAFDPSKCAAPLPRAFQWIDRPSDTELRRGASDHFLAPRDEVDLGVAGSVDVEARLAVIVGDVAAGVTAESAIDGVRLVMLAAAVVVDRDADAGLATAFSPVAATPDELAPGWQGGQLNFNLEVHWNGKRFGLLPAGPGMQPHFGDLVAEAAARRAVAAGSIVGSGPVRHAEASRGFACLADKRAQEARDAGEAKTSFMRPGDRVRIDMKGADGHSLFGAIELRAAGAAEPPAPDAPPQTPAD